MERVRGEVGLAALTRSADGSVLVAGRADPVRSRPRRSRAVVDTTGAGDLYAAGLLYGLTHDLPLAACGRLGGLAAAHGPGPARRPRREARSRRWSKRPGADHDRRDPGLALSPCRSNQKVSGR